MLQHTVDWDIHLDPYVLSTMRCHLDVWMSGNRVYIAISKYSLHPKKQVIIGFKICPQKQVILLYLESACTCKNQLVPNMGSK